ncbi:farnesyl diphosphate synthase [Luteimonas arsenica]|uniref:farnesyl diphosphate synthase n=1 Tax=Luteimonas arsenica TaxID=1586242 RepID=UPI00105600C9|nr:farnesyl diphosphate synthase [Luteimonas arsenica]
MPEAGAGAAGTAARLEDWRQRIDRVLEAALARHPAAEQRLGAAMRHAVLLGGKRMRPLLAYAAGTAFGADEAALDAPAAAIELVHAYSLVHDDLPAMDDDALRRGQPTVHVAFDEATAILAGDALQSLAFAVLADAACDDAARVAMLRELAVAAGAGGMCGGQAIDLAATGSGGSAGLEALERLHALKTGALIRAAVRIGAIAAGAGADDRRSLDAYADALGLAFQVRDDLLDVEGESATLGKTAGKDAAQDKATFPALIGIEASRARLHALSAAMDAALAPLGTRTAELAALGELAIKRSH